MSAMVLGGCGDCICRSCLYWWSQRCPYGGCWDDHRAKIEPWSGRERKSWTNWDKPGEQAHWCRGGAFYPVDACPEYVYYDYDKTVVQDCLDSVIVKYQDGYIQCSLINTVGCEECYRRFEAKTE